MAAKITQYCCSPRESNCHSSSQVIVYLRTFHSKEYFSLLQKVAKLAQNNAALLISNKILNAHTIDPITVVNSDVRLSYHTVISEVFVVERKGLF